MFLVVADRVDGCKINGCKCWRWYLPKSILGSEATDVPEAFHLHSYSTRNYFLLVPFFDVAFLCENINPADQFSCVCCPKVRYMALSDFYPRPKIALHLLQLKKGLIQIHHECLILPRSGNVFKKVARQLRRSACT